MNNARLLGLLAAGVLMLTACSPTETAPNSFPGAMLSGNDVYLARAGHLYRHNLSDGAQVWQFPATEVPAISPMSGQPVKFGDTVIVGSGVGPEPRFLFGVSGEGTEAWRFTRAREFVDGVVTDGKLVYAANGDGSLYALDPARKQPREYQPSLTFFEQNLPAFFPPSAPPGGEEPSIVWQFKTGNRLWSKPLLANGVLYQGSMDHKLYALDAATGKELWRYEGAAAPIAAQPVLADGVIYFGSLDSSVYAVDIKTGKARWSSKTEGWVWCEAAVGDGKVILGDVKGNVYALNTSDGSQAWRFATADSVRAQPVISDGKVFIVSFDTHVYALNLADGKQVWKNSLKFRLPSSPIMTADNRLLVPLFDSDVKAWTVNPSNGNTDKALSIKK